MKYGVELRNMHNGIHEIIVFDSNKETKECFNILHGLIDSNIESEDYHMFAELAIQKAVDIVEINYRDISEIMELEYYINESGIVTSHTDKIKIINAGMSIDIY